MCGISALLDFGGEPVRADALRRMCSAIRHRGPDDAGYALVNGGSVGLGHVRLSILDLVTGDQPIYNEDQSVCVVYNGEIYDHVELRNELVARGHRFTTRTDTEVIVHLYEEYGMDFFERLNGEFAFVLWDQRRRRLLAARDRSGIKPLFYHRSGAQLALCSEVKGLLALDHVPRELSKDYLTGPLFGAFPRSFSAFEEIASVEPGHFLLAGEGGVEKEHAYWNLAYDVDDSMTREQAVEGVRHHLRRAVHRRMVADVPVNMYLSGGIDSSLICSMMTERQPVIAYTIAFPGSRHDESEQARAVARHYGAQLEVVDCTLDLLAEHFERTIYHTEIGVANPSAVAKVLLSERVRAQGYKVCLTGEGADEVFAGYPYFKLEMLWRMMAEGGDAARRAKALWRQFKRIEIRSEGLMWNRGSRWKTEATPLGYPCFHQIRAGEYGSLIPLLFDRGLGLGERHTPEAAFARNVDALRLSRLHPVNAAREVTFQQLYDYVLRVMGDRPEMANSIECRTPYLDRDLLEFSGRMPPEYLVDIDALREKRILHDAFGHALPARVKRDHKHTFRAPGWKTLDSTRAGAALIDDYLSEEAIRAAGIFDRRFVRLARSLWRRAPLTRGLRTRLDILIGVILGVQVLHRSFVANRVAADPDFRMVDRSPAAAGA